MMDLFKNLALILTVPPVITLFYDLIYNWFIKATFELEKLSFWWKKMSPAG